MTSKKRKNYGYDTNKISYSPGMLVGLNDTDGGFHTRIRFRKNGTVYYECLMQVRHQKDNIDVLNSCQHTIGLGKVYQYQEVIKIRELETRSRKTQGALFDSEIQSELSEASKDIKTTCVYRLDLGSKQAKNFYSSFLEKNKPVMPSKLFDYLILSVLLLHMSLNYSVFNELNSLNDLCEKDEILTASSFSSFSHKEKTDASKIACIYLNNFKSSKRQKSLGEKQVIFKNSD